MSLNFSVWLFPSTSLVFDLWLSVLTASPRDAVVLALLSSRFNLYNALISKSISKSVTKTKGRTTRARFALGCADAMEPSPRHSRRALGGWSPRERCSFSCFWFVLLGGGFLTPKPLRRTAVPLPSSLASSKTVPLLPHAPHINYSFGKTTAVWRRMRKPFLSLLFCLKIYFFCLTCFPSWTL